MKQLEDDVVSKGDGTAVALDALTARFATLLTDNGLHAALGFLNSRTRYRFTGVYRFDPPMLRNVALFDRENPSLRAGGDLPMLGSPCSLVKEAIAPFAASDTRLDDRLARDAPRWSIIAYCGAPLIADDQSCFGSLCHYDARPRLAPVTEIPFLEQAARLVMRVVARPQVA